MTHFVKFFVLLVLLTQYCVADEYSALCDFISGLGVKCSEEKVKKQCEMSNSTYSHSLTFGDVSATCTSKHIVDLSASGLEKPLTFPASFSDMVYLKNLNLANNAITVFPSVLGKMPSLKTLNLASNSLITVTEDLGNITSLDTLNLASNGIKSLPALGSLTALKNLYLHGNGLTTITGVFPNSNKLTSVYLKKNELTELPPEFGMCTSLKYFYFDDNEIHDLPKEYEKLKNLVKVGMSENYFNCENVTANFTGTAFADGCVQAQQKTENEVSALPTSFSTEPPTEGLDKYEITSLILFFVFLIGAAIAIIFYVRYRNGGMAA